MYDIHIHGIVFKLCIGKKEKRKVSKIEIFTIGFLNFEIG